MNDLVIRAEGLGKAYTISHEELRRGASYRSLREDLQRALKEPVRRMFGRPARRRELFWALRDVSFDVRRGEVLGIIGRNGAGKSTLLKILSRITEPTSGHADVYGRVGSLLEIGTGFHPELSGKENIFLNGAILGMKRCEVQQLFDEIVQFADVEKFLDTPVKRYSSGMYLRLAFAVAAHLESEILIVDEVLAVGDAEFQKKCLDKMKEVELSGRTVLFVTHNMSAVSSLCSRALLIKGGSIGAEGPAVDVIRQYVSESMNHGELAGLRLTSSYPGFEPSHGTWECGELLEVTVAWEAQRFAPGWECDLACYGVDGVKYWALESQKLPGFDSRDPQAHRIVFRIRNPGLNDRPLRLDVGIRPGPHERYSVLVENALFVYAGSRGLPEYKRNDVILVPSAECEVTS